MTSQVLLAQFKESHRVRLLLMGVEGRAIRVQLVKDALKRLAFNRMAGVDDRTRLALLDPRGSLRDQLVEARCCRFILQVEAHDQSEHCHSLYVAQGNHCTAARLVASD